MSQNNVKEQENWTAIARYLESIGHTLDRDVTICELSGGAANLNFLISMNDQQAVLRRPPDGPLPPGANDVAREYKVLSNLGSEFPPAPKGLVFCDDLDVIGVPFCISEFRKGVCIGRHLPEDLKSVANIGDRLSELVVGTLVDLHKVNLDNANLTDLGKIDGFLERQVEGWYKRGGHVLNEAQLAKLGQAREWLQGNLPERRLGSLVHNDFKLDNMLVDTDTLEVSGVVDWDMCTIGDPFYELTILLSYWGAPDDTVALSRTQCRMPCEAEGWWEKKKVVEEYTKRTGYNLSEADLAFYLMLTSYRTAVVLAQLISLFSRTGKRPDALSQEECDQMPAVVEALLQDMVDNLGGFPAWYN